MENNKRRIAKEILEKTLSVKYLSGTRYSYLDEEEIELIINAMLENSESTQDGMIKNTENWIENSELGIELYEALYSKLPTIDSNGTVSEEHVWDCVNEVLPKIRGLHKVIKLNWKEYNILLENFHSLQSENERLTKEVEKYQTDLKNCGEVSVELIEENAELKSLQAESDKMAVEFVEWAIKKCTAIKYINTQELLTEYKNSKK